MSHNYRICVDALVIETAERCINGVTIAAIAKRIETHRGVQLCANETRPFPGLKNICQRGLLTRNIFKWTIRCQSDQVPT